MSAMNLSMDELCATVLRLLGRTPDDPDLQRFLSAVGCWPIPAFAEERFTYSFEDQQRGFALTFQDAATLPAENKIPGVPARTPVFIGAVLYSEGKDDYHQFAGKIPGGATWADTPSALETKLGPPKHVVKNTKTGALMGYRWAMEGHIFATAFRKNGTISTMFLSLF